MRIAFITAGAAGMFCGSCMRDNTLAAALIKRGHDALLIPTYTPIRTDEADVSQRRVFFGGINVFLQQKAWLFRHTPWLLDRLLDFPRLLRWVSRFARNVNYSDLGDLTISMLEGRHGKQRKELAKLTGWLKNEIKPDVVLLTNALLSGLVPEIKRALGVPVLVTLQGDDIFLDVLPKPDRERCVELIRENGRAVDGWISTSRYNADHMAGYLGIDRGAVHVVHPGLKLAPPAEPRPVRGGPPYTVGYFARICPEKGFHNAVDAFIHLRRTPGAPHVEFRASGWLGDNNRVYYEREVAKLREAGLLDGFHHVECPDHASKMAFFRSVDVLTVPTTYREPKGLYVLEAWENGVPVVLPEHGSFPELVEATGAGVLVPPNDAAALADALGRLLEDAPGREAMARRGSDAVRERFSADAMATATVKVLERYVRS